MKIGTTDIKKMFLGTTEVKKIFSGTTEVWSDAVGGVLYMLGQSATDATTVLLTSINTVDSSFRQQVSFTTSNGLNESMILVNKKYVIVQVIEPSLSRYIIRVYSSEDLTLLASSYNTTMFTEMVSEWYYGIAGTLSPDDDEYMYMPPFPYNGQSGAKIQISTLSVIDRISVTNTFNGAFQSKSNESSNNCLIRGGYFYFFVQNPVSPFYALCKWNLTTNSLEVSTTSFDGIDSTFYAMAVSDTRAFIFRNYSQTQKILVVNLTNLAYIGVSPALTWYSSLPIIFKVVGKSLYIGEGYDLYKFPIVNVNSVPIIPGSGTTVSSMFSSSSAFAGVQGDKIVVAKDSNERISLLSITDEQATNYSTYESANQIYFNKNDTRFPIAMANTTPVLFGALV